MSNETQNIFKGKTEEEIKAVYNSKWLAIIRNCLYKKSEKSQTNRLQQSGNDDIISTTAKQFCSANLEKEEWNEKWETK